MSDEKPRLLEDTLAYFESSISLETEEEDFSTFFLEQSEEIGKFQIFLAKREFMNSENI